MRNKKILIPGWAVGDNSWGVTKPYLHYFSKFGQVDILSPRKDIVNCDLLVLPGGLDVSPFNYDGVPGFMTSNTDVYKQYFMDRNLIEYVMEGIPIFGICLGMQQLAVKFGYPMEQHVNLYYSNPRTETKEELVVSPRLVDSMHIKGLKVNSLHHQVVDSASILTENHKDFISIAISKTYGNIEAMAHKNFQIAGVQWHPEEIEDQFSEILINKLLERNLHSIFK
jgi:putative glutamine amidotransferase